MASSPKNHNGFPFPALPLELTRVFLCFLDLPTLLALACTSTAALGLLDREEGLWRLWADRWTPQCMDLGDGSTQIHGSVHESSMLAAAGPPYPWSALFPPGHEALCLHRPPCRRSLAAFHAARSKVLESHLAPLWEGGEGAGGKLQPCLVSQYFHAYDVLVTLRGEEAVDAILHAHRRRLQELVRHASSAAYSHPPSLLSPLSVLLALHLLYRATPSSSSSSSSSSSTWRGRLLSFLAQGPFQGLAVVAFWTMGSHNPQNGFRARDVLKSEKLDLRRIACLLKGKGREGGRGKAQSEEERHGAAVERTLAKLESLRGMMPTVTLSPAVVYVGGVEADNSMCENAEGYFALSSSPPRR